MSSARKPPDPGGCASLNRRQLLASGVLAGGVLLAPQLAGPAVAQSTRTARTGAATVNLPAPWFELGWFDDPLLDQVLIFYLGATWQHGADVGEVFDTASRINYPADEWSWAHEWTRTADRLREQADATEAAGHGVSGGELFLRASTYYRAAMHRHPDPTTPDVPQIVGRAVECFDRAVAWLEPEAESVRIPYQRTTLPGYYYHAQRTHGKAPLLIVHQGRDAWAADNRYIANAAVRRGYHCLLFDGPGQGPALRLQGLSFRHDWERVISPVVDFAVRRRGVDHRRIALMGISMGGYLAPRAAAFEPRLKALIANPGVMDWAQINYAAFDAAIPGITKLLETDPAAFDAQLQELVNASDFYRWAVRDIVHKHASRTLSEALLKLKAYNLEGVIDRIQCRTLVMDGSADPFAQGQRFYTALKAPKDYMLFTDQDAAQTHVQTGALGLSSQRMLDWLDEHL